MPTRYEELRAVLMELFQFDRADLDFGIYRIMNQKRDEITRFLDNDLKPQVEAALAAQRGGEAAELRAELDQVVANLRDAGVDPENAPKVKELRGKIKEAGDPETLAEEIFSSLASFFRRYYDKGDFISQRRYKKDVYAIPYEGEEVKLYWANSDQYYIKTAEYFRDYTFTIDEGKRRVHFKIADADVERNNNKAQEGKERRFILAQSDPVIEEAGELIIRFEYRPDDGGRKQPTLNEQARDHVLATPAAAGWTKSLAALHPTEKNPKRTLLDKKLDDYTARNTFDYFIHKDLGGFLRRELDFYIKNEIVQLDDIDSETAPRVAQYLGKLRVLRRLAHKIIDFLAQLEEFQKRLWLKKKFVVECGYCITLGHIKPEYYPAIAANDAQREEWVRLFAIDEIGSTTVSPAYSVPLTPEFLRANQNLIVDTRFFDKTSADALIAGIEGDLDAATNGLIINSENFQALALLKSRYAGYVNCIYIDPPYNTGPSLILYKNDYEHASWLSLMADRLTLARSICTAGVTAVAIDDAEQERLGALLCDVYPDQKRTCITVVHNPTGQQSDNFSPTHEYVYFMYPAAGKRIGMQNREHNPDVRPLRDVSIGNHLRTDAANCFYPIYVKNRVIVGFGDVCDDDFHPHSANVTRPDGVIEVYPIGASGEERKWVFARNSVPRILPELSLEFNRQRQIWDVIRTKTRFNFKTVWTDKEYSANSYGAAVLRQILQGTAFTYPKSIHAVEDCIRASTNENASALILDYFAGSGTTGHAVINLNREDGGSRKYILVEMGEYFDTVLKPRIRKVIYSKDWKSGKPVSREGDTKHIVKYLKLESYEDTLNNLELRRTQAQEDLLSEHAALREDYLLRYTLDDEARGSGSLLNVDAFVDPFSYELDISTGSAGETKRTKVDLVETFNYLVGLRVQRIETLDGFRIVYGVNPAGEKVFVVWRNTNEKSNSDLDEFFNRIRVEPRGSEFDLIYVNGDNNLENLRRDDETWKVRLIEKDFLRLMFETADAEAVGVGAAN